MQKCEYVPQIAMTRTHGQTAAVGVRQTSSAGMAPIADCTTSIQKTIVTALSVRVSDLTRITEIAKPTAAASAISWPGSTWSTPGRTMTATPTTPSTTATTRAALSRSPRNETASSAVQIGIVNSIATTCAIGISVSAKNQPNCAA